MSRVLALFVFILFISCHSSHRPAGTQKQAPAATAIQKKKTITPLINTSYSEYLKLFKTVTPPYSFNSDSIYADLERFNNYDITTHDEVDSLGTPVSTTLIPQKFAQRWMVDSNAAGLKNEWISDRSHLEVIYDGDTYWHALRPFKRIQHDTCDVLLIAYYEAMSATNGGYTEIIALTYNKDHRLTKVLEIGIDGCYRRMDMNSEGTYAKESFDYTHLSVTVQQNGRVLAKETEIMNAEISKGNRQYKTKKQLGVKHKTLHL